MLKERPVKQLARSMALIWLHVVSCLSIMASTCLHATTFKIDTRTPGPALIDEFLSITVDSGLAGHWNEFDFNSKM